ncbi:hypothetical protein [Phyllobacterium ifriqiyense]|uniref:hypothetical protein n=1 Tax=Phyllobacterium ifriqiyense TaxID=314238 RepID=UPI003393ED91
MTKFTLLMLLGSALSLAACSPTVSNSSAGWHKIPVKPATAVYLAGNDLAAGQGIAGHNAFGKSRKCW